MTISPSDLALILEKIELASLRASEQLRRQNNSSAAATMRQFASQLATMGAEYERLKDSTAESTEDSAAR